MNSRDVVNRWLSLILSSLGLALGLSALLGWHIHNPRITQWGTDKTPMVYNTAISFVVVGAALLAAILGRRISAALAIIGGLPSLLTLFEYVTGLSLGIDELLMKSRDSSPYPGRIAPNTALCLLLLSAAVLCTTERKRFRGRTFGPMLVSVALGIGAVSLFGYLTGFATFGWGRFIPMAAPTAVGLTLLSLAALSLYWRLSERSDKWAPSWLYITVTVGAMVMAVSVWQSLIAEEQSRIAHTVDGQIESVRARLLTELEFRTAAVARFARRWERRGSTQQWEMEAGLLMKDVPGFQAIGWADPLFRVRWVYPQEVNEALLYADLSSDPRRRSALEAARDSQRTIVTRAVQLLTGGRGFHAYAPIYRRSVFQGVMVAGFRFQDFFSHIVDPTVMTGYAIAIYDGEEEIYFRAPPGEQRGSMWQRQVPLRVENAGWILKLWPTPSTLANVESTASTIVLTAGLVLSLLLGLAVYLAQTARLKIRLAERAREELEKEVGERRRAEQELDQFFTVAPDMLCIAGFDGYFKRLNPAWVTTLGWTVEQLQAAPLADFIHPDDVQSTRDVIEKQRDGTSISCFENRYRARDGSYRWMRWSSRPNPDRQLIFAAARDVTAEKTAEEELRQASTYNRSLIEASLDPLVTIASDGRITDVNYATEQVTGLSRRALIGTDFCDYFTNPERARAGYQRVFKEGWTQDYELELRHRDGSIRPVLYNASLYRNDAGETVGIFAAARDITERKRVEEEIKELNASLERRVAERTADLLVLNQELESFNYSVSHDLRAPLRHIDGFSKLLLDQYAAILPEEGHRSVERIREGARRMGRMVDELLELSRTSRREVSKQLTGLGSLVAEVLEDLKPEVQDREIEWCIGELPFADCDPTLTRQVFANLLGNAVKFTRHRKPARIEVGQTVSQGHKVLFVRDNGVGFSMKYVDKLFGIFQRLHRREDFEGTGVGLVTVQRIIHKHGGRIWAEAELEKGATFYFTLEPLFQAQPEESHTEATLVFAGER